MSHLQEVLSSGAWHFKEYIRCMSIQFIYEDGQGTVVDGQGRPEPLDYVIDEEQYALETVSSYTQYLRNQPRERDRESDDMQTEDAKKDVDVHIREASTKRVYTLYTDQDKVRFFKLLFEKCLSASAAAKQLGIHVRTGQRWAKHEEHKKVISEYIDVNPSAVLEQVMERLLQRFEGLKVSKSTVSDFLRAQCNLSLKKARFQPVDRNSEKIQERRDWVRKWEGTYMDFRTNCVFLDESAFHVNMKRSMAWSKKGSPAVVTVPKTRAQTTTILGAISASGLMDQYPHMKGYYSKYITSRGYRYAYLPPYSPELNPIEQLWSVVKSKVKRNRFLEKETLMTRISEAADSLNMSDYEDESMSAHCMWGAHNCVVLTTPLLYAGILDQSNSDTHERCYQIHVCAEIACIIVQTRENWDKIEVALCEM
ncbi:hypothetical protein VTP01DRAFT_7285 [Rhizomucor pusillus]|uniref:uncharacterized protein n=1 Tax=Rhizomucor pusillus TaxID=4840 RepID=UPI003741EA35